MNKLKHLPKTQLASLFQENKNTVYFGELYEQYYSKIYSYSLKQTDSHEAAHNAVTTYFVNMAEKISDIEQPEQFVQNLFNNITKAGHQTDNVLEAIPTTF